MKKLRLTKGEFLVTLSIIVGVASTAAGLSATMVSADSPPTASTQPSSSIGRSVIRTDKLDAMAGALNMTTAQVQSHLKAHDLKQVVANAGLSDASFHQKVLAQLQSELQAQGYSQTQITAVLQHFQAYSNRQS